MNKDRFIYYMEEIQQEYLQREQFYAIGLDLSDFTHGFHGLVDLLSETMGDYEKGLIPYFIFECRFGAEPMELDNGELVKTVEELYGALTEGNN